MITGTLLHSVSYSGSWGQHGLTLEEFVDKAADLGFDGLMIGAKRPHFSLLDYPPERRGELKRRIGGRGLRNTLLAAYNNFTSDLIHAEIPHSEFQVHYLTELSRAARDIGSDRIRVFTGYEDGAATFGRQWDLVVNCLREAAKRAANFGVTLGVQNHHDIAVDHRSLVDLVAEVGEPNCRAMFDAWAPALQSTDLARSAALLAPMTVHTTVANYSLRPRFRYVPELVNYEQLTARVQAVPMDEGFIDYRTFFRAMHEGGFTGTVAYEMCSPLLGGGSEANLDRYAKRFLDFMKDAQ